MALSVVPGYGGYRGYVPGGSNAAQTAAAKRLISPRISMPQPYVPGGTNAAQIADYQDRFLPAPLSPAAPIDTITAPAPSVGGGGGGGGAGAMAPAAPPAVPDLTYEQMIQADPLYAGAQASYQSALDRGRASLKEQVQNAVLQSGFTDLAQNMTGRLADYASDVDPATITAAMQNPFSTKALLEQILGRNQRGVGYDLAARGTLRSGALNNRSNMLQQKFGQDTYAQMQSLLASLRGGIDQYGNLSDSAFAAWQQARSEIAQRLAQMPGPTAANDPTGGAGGGGVVDDGSGGGTTAPGPGLPAPVNAAADAAASYQTPGPTGLPFPIPIVPGGAYTQTDQGPQLTDISGTRPGTTLAEAIAGFDTGDFLTPQTAPQIAPPAPAPAPAPMLPPNVAYSMLNPTPPPPPPPTPPPPPPPAPNAGYFMLNPTPPPQPPVYYAPPPPPPPPPSAPVPPTPADLRYQAARGGSPYAWMA